MKRIVKYLFSAIIHMLIVLCVAHSSFAFLIMVGVQNKMLILFGGILCVSLSSIYIRFHKLWS